MKKILTIGLILILGFVFLAGCAQNPPPKGPVDGPPKDPASGGKATQNQPPADDPGKGAPPAGDPAKGAPPAGSPAGQPGVAPVNELDYLRGVTVKYSKEADPSTGKAMEEKSLDFPEGTTSVIVVVEKNPDLTREQEAEHEITLINKNYADKPVVSKKFEGKDLKKKGMEIILSMEGKTLVPGPYMVLIKNVKSGKKMEINFNVQGAVPPIEGKNAPKGPPPEGQPGGEPGKEPLKAEPGKAAPDKDKP